MPQIPGVNESQILNASSPVPIAAPEESRLLGTAIARAGQGAFALGDALDSAAMKEKARRDVISEQLAQQQARQALLKEFAARQAAAPIQDDVTGIKQVEEFTKNSQEAINQIADQLPDPKVRAGFLARIGDNVNDMGKELYGHEIAKREKQNDAMRTQLISGNAALAGQNPNQIPELLAQTELAINNDPGEAPALKVEKILKAKQQVILGAVDGQLESKNYKMAENIVTHFGNGILDPKERQKMIEDIRDSDYKNANREMLAMTSQEKRVEMRKKEVQAKTADGYIAAFADAANNENKRQPLIQNLELDLLKENVSKEFYMQVTGAKVFPRPLDEKYDGDIMAKVFKDNDYAGAVTRVQADREAGKVSYDKSAELINRLNALDERKKNDPNSTARIKIGEKLINNMADPSIISGMLDDMTKKEQMTKVTLAVADYQKFVSKNPKSDPVEYAKFLVKDRFDARTGFQRGREDYMAFDSVEAVQQQMDKISTDAFAKKKAGLMNSYENDKVRHNMQLLQKRKIELMNDKEAKGASSGASGINIQSIVPQLATPTRGRK